MDETDIYRASSSLRANSSSIWRNTGVEIFCRSSRRDDYDDEEALKWATLQKLTTYDRLRKGLLVKLDGSGGNGIDEVDIQKLGVQEKKELLERLMRDSEGGTEKFLLKLGKRLHRVGIDLPKIEVRFDHLNVDAKVYVGSRALPTFLNSVWNVLEGFMNCFHILQDRKKNFSILSDVSGIIKPGRMTLLLGPPSSGKTTLLLALAGKLDPDLKISGRVTYNGHGMHEFVPHRTAAYISQNDCHIGELTVKETLAFSARCQGVGFRYEMLAELSRREKEANIKPDPDIDLFMKAAAIEGQEASVVADYVLKLLGLEICADTMVGSDMMRGVSGGQKKRVTTGEMKGVADFLQEVTSKQDQEQYWLLNEFLGHQWNHVLPNTTEPLGIIILKSRGFFPFLNPIGKPQAVVPEEGYKGRTEKRIEQGSSKDRDDRIERHSPRSSRTTEHNVEANHNRRKGMVLPFEPHSITFDDITYSVDMPRQLKEQGITDDKLMLLKAWLRLPSDVDSGSKKMFVEEVMELVELKSLRDALVGLPGVSGLSTEQRKRLTIAVELVANPSIIFMDEPTSGLDARAAAIVMRTVRNTVDTGRTVVCTIHQPSIDIFEAFDELLLMKQGGLELYVGPVGRHSCELIKYFEELEGISKISEGYNPATWALDVTSSKQEMILGINFTEVYRNSDLYRRNKALIKDLSTPRPGSMDLSFRTQFFFTTVTALLFGTIFWDLGTKRTIRQDLFNSMGSMYTAVIFIGVQNASSVQPVVAVERTVLYRERAAGMYSSLAYALAQVVVEIPYIFVQTVLVLFTDYGIYFRDLLSLELGCHYGGDGITGYPLLHGHCMDY
ncbi:hypothetical protein POM88_013025 [Heracleum sosnowskyi]|uniref:ABC transporter domain-containing protein n=1 Tax=Heracleum sosnowskyi TaxID=360622 RepID=A0AAD8IXK4_9APIA|nr:hypothetical protein POM88_013025 [Heracleum sosnowskyi]